MKKWGKSLAALAVLAVLFSFGALRNSAQSSSTDQNLLTPAPVKTQPQSKSNQQPPTNVQDKKVETKQLAVTQQIPFQALTQNDNTLPKGVSKIATQGVNGTKLITYKVTYIEGLETAREKLSEVVSTQPIDQITKVGTHEAELHADSNSPAGATALCADGILSYAQNHQGACSRHGGVSIWYQ
jgi:uncharacterized protein YabE (DUF348 family)